MSATVVSESEHGLLAVTRGLVGEASPAETQAAIRMCHQPPKGLTAGAMAIFQDTLAKGAVMQLIRRGGWIATGAEGRLWQRHPPPELRFTGYSFELCRWLTSGPQWLAEAAPKALPEGLGDELTAYLAGHLLSELEAPVVAAVPLRSSPLCRLAFPELFAGGDLPAPSYRQLARGDGLIVLEGLQADLAARFEAVERHKSAIAGAAELSALGVAQEQALEAYLAAVDEAGRRDLASFLVQGARRLLQTRPQARLWIRSLDRTQPLSERAAAARAAAAGLRAVALRVGGWWRDFAAVRFFDDDYDLAQRVLSVWEPLGQRGFTQADRLRQQLESLPATTPQH